MFFVRTLIAAALAVANLCNEFNYFVEDKPMPPLLKPGTFAQARAIGSPADSATKVHIHEHVLQKLMDQFESSDRPAVLFGGFSGEDGVIISGARRFKKAERQAGGYAIGGKAWKAMLRDKGQKHPTLDIIGLCCTGRGGPEPPPDMAAIMADRFTGKRQVGMILNPNDLSCHFYARHEGAILPCPGYYVLTKDLTHSISPVFTPDAVSPRVAPEVTAQLLQHRRRILLLTVLCSILLIMVIALAANDATRTLSAVPAVTAADWQWENSILTKRLDILEQNLTLITQKNTGLGDEAALLKNEIQSLKDQLDEQRADADGLRAQIANGTSGRQQQDDSIALLKSTVEELEAEIARLRQQNPAAGATLHVVEAGETLSSISQRYYGTAGRAHVIAGFNGIADADAIAAGTELWIPVLG